MADQSPARCPQCTGPLEVSALRCPACELTISGAFRRCRFCELPPEHLQFLEVFVRSRGVIRQVEKELGLSYPTVRARLDALLRALGYEGDQQGAGESVRGVLGKLERGELTADEAAAQIRALKGGQ